MSALRSWDVQVTLLSATAKIAQTAVTVTSLNPGEACRSAYVVVRDDLKRSKEAGKGIPTITAVTFLVRVSKKENPT